MTMQPLMGVGLNALMLQRQRDERWEAVDNRPIVRPRIGVLCPLLKSVFCVVNPDPGRFRSCVPCKIGDVEPGAHTLGGSEILRAFDLS